MTSRGSSDSSRRTSVPARPVVTNLPVGSIRPEEGLGRKRDRTGHDFSLYKKNTLCRRIERRMHVQQIDSIVDYVRYLQESEREAGVLFKELLIGVTSFFRDPLAFGPVPAKWGRCRSSLRPYNST